MGNEWIRAVWLVFVAIAVGCGGAAATSSGGNFTVGPMPAGGEWTGIYYSDWGRLEMQQTGDTVVGEFRSDAKRGRLSGRVNGNLLTFQFTQNDDTIPGRPRTFQGSGQFRYYIDQVGDHMLAGTWGFGAAVDDGGPWNASRSTRSTFQFLTQGGARRATTEEDDAVGTPPEEGTEGTEPTEPTEDEDELGDL